MKHRNIYWIVLYFTALLLSGCTKPELRPSIPPEFPATPVVPCPGRPIVNATLVPVGSLSLERSAIKSATAGDKLLFVGGYNSGFSYPDDNTSLLVDIYDFVTDTWTTATLEGTYREGTAIASSGSKIFIAGGRDPQGYSFTSRVDIYDASTNSWSFANLYAPKADMAAGFAGNKVVFAGGHGFEDIFEPLYDADIYDIPTNTWTKARLSAARGQISSTTVGNKMYFAGGQTNIALFDNIDIYDAATNSWDTAYLEEPRGRISGVGADDKIFWAGGLWLSPSASLTGLDRVEIKDVNTGASSFECFIPSYDFVSVQKGNFIVFFTGNIADDSHTYFELFNTSTQQWSTGKLDFKITAASVICANNTIYVAGGNDGNGTHYKQVWKLEF